MSGGLVHFILQLDALSVNLVIGIKKKRMYKVSLIKIINITIGLWFGTANIIMFLALRSGSYIYEPNPLIATIELIIASITAAWFAWQIPYMIIKAMRGNKEDAKE